MVYIEVPLVRDYILIVDDEISIAKLLKRIMIDDGEIHIAYDVEKGLECILKQDYDLIISDIDMPQKDGLCFYIEATQRKPNLKGKFLFMSGTINDERLAFFQKHGIEHLIKPSSVMDIRIAAKKILLLKKTSV